MNGEVEIEPDHMDTPFITAPTAEFWEYIGAKDHAREERILIDMNDAECLNFIQIADWIEENVDIIH
jgi:hypothetical protein